METNLSKIKTLAKEREDENWRFRYFLKRCDIPPEEIDRMVHELYAQISMEVDCTKCGNCCRTIQPTLDGEDVERLSSASGMSIAQFKAKYLVEDETSGRFLFKEKPCPILKDNHCLFYNHRPKDCASYPHLHKEGFVLRLMEVIQNASICPIVFNVYEQLKQKIWTKRRKRGGGYP